MSNIKLYRGANTVDSILQDNIIIGEDTFVQKSELGSGVQLNRRNIIIECKVGDYTYTGANTIIKCADIGKFCSISWNVSMTGNQHDYNLVTTHPFIHLKNFGFVDDRHPLEKQRVTVENDVWIGMNTSILPGIKIGSGAVIGAGSVVTKDVPPYAIVVGNPAKIIKYRFSDETISDLLEISWWNWPYGIIKKNINLFKRKAGPDIIRDMLCITKRIKEGV